MSDQFDSLFDSLRGQRPPLPFALAADVRRRGRQRAHRQVASAGVAVLAVAGLGTGTVLALAGQPESAPAPPAGSTEPTSPPVTARPTGVAEDRLLAVADLGAGDWRAFQGAEPLENGTYFACAGFGADDFASLSRRMDAATSSWERDLGAPMGSITQAVELFEPGAGDDNVADVRAALAACSEGPSVAEEVAPPDHTVIDEGFAGDESLLVRMEQYSPDDAGLDEGTVTLIAVVRMGDVVTTIPMFAAAPGDEIPPGAEDFLRDVAIRAADRLR